MAEEQDKVDRLLQKRAELERKIQRIQGQLDAAKANHERVVQKCRAKGIEPEDLPAKIAQLKEKFRNDSDAYEAKLLSAQEALKPFLERSV